MRMQPGVTVVLATVWLVVSVGVVEPSTLHPSHLALDQYSPLPAYHHGVYRRVEGQLDWKDQNPAENQPFDLSIGPQRSISVNESPRLPFVANYPGKDLTVPNAENEVTSSNDFSSLRDEDKKSRNFPASKLADDKAKLRTTMILEPSSREIPPSELEDPFVADETFQDQGPGSVEIYKLDLFIEKDLMSPTSTSRPLLKSKSKVPKKTGRFNWKSKTGDYKTTSPKIRYKQSNSFDESPTVVPPHSETFGVGGVPELQVGCEGIEASVHKLKRSIDSPGKEKDLGSIGDSWVDVTPISLDLDYELSSEDGYEEMDELLKLKKLETTTERVKQKRGDMEATLHSEFFADKRRNEKLPVRGDLGKSGNTNDSAIPTATSVTSNRKTEEKRSLIEPYKVGSPGVEIKPDIPGEDDPAVNQGRKLLWFEDPVERLEDQKRSKRTIWGFGEDEGVVSSDELQTENQRRRQEYERRRKEQERRRQEELRKRGNIDNETNSEIENIRDEYERALEQRQREEEERQRRIEQEESRRNTANRWSEEERGREEERRREQEQNPRRINQYPRNQMEEERRRRLQEDEMRRNRWNERQREHDTSRTRYDNRPRNPPDEDTESQRSREEEMRRRDEDLEKRRMRQRQEEEDRQRERDLEMRRREEARQIEIQRRQEEQDRKSMEERRREWALKRKQEEKEDAERRRQHHNRNETPSNLYTFRSRLNDSRTFESDEDRRLREQQEREREEKLREYIHRNRPINVDRSAVQRREEEERRRLEEQRRRERPEDRQDPAQNLTDRRREEEERRRLENERRRYRPDDRQNRTENSPDRRREEEERRRLEDQRRRQRPDDRQDPNESLRDRRRQEEERRRMEEQRRRQRPDDRQEPNESLQDRRREEEERRRMEEQRRRHRPDDRQESNESLQDRRRQEEERRRMEEQRRRQRPDDRQDPAQNLTDSRREEEERRRLENERRRHRPEDRQDEERRRIEHERRLEEERKLKDYIRRNQPVHVSRKNESQDKNWLDYARTMDEARLYDHSRYPAPDTGRRSHGPSASTNIDPRSYVDEARRQQEARRLEEESRIRERQRQEQEERRKEALRREEEVRRMQSRRYEDERKRLEAVRLEAERRTKELKDEERRRSQAGRTRTSENARPVYENGRRFEEQRGRQDTSLVPGNLVLDESRRAMERERQRQAQERRRNEAERRRVVQDRTKETRQNEEHDRAMKEQWRRQEQVRLNALPVSARIMLRPGKDLTSTPAVLSRTGFDNGIDFSGINPHRHGVEASRFPAAATLRPPVKSPGPCTWAVLQCCPANSNRLVTCFESMGCPGINWDPSPCRADIAQAAREEVMKFYVAEENNQRS